MVYSLNLVDEAPIPPVQQAVFSSDVAKMLRIYKNKGKPCLLLS